MRASCLAVVANLWVICPCIAAGQAESSRDMARGMIDGIIYCPLTILVDDVALPAPFDLDMLPQPSTIAGTKA